MFGEILLHLRLEITVMEILKMQQATYWTEILSISDYVKV